MFFNREMERDYSEKTVHGKWMGGSKYYYIDPYDVFNIKSCFYLSEEEVDSLKTCDKLKNSLKKYLDLFFSVTAKRWMKSLKGPQEKYFEIEFYHGGKLFGEIKLNFSKTFKSNLVAQKIIEGLREGKVEMRRGGIGLMWRVFTKKPEEVEKDIKDVE